MTDDSTLLRRFVESRSNQAFGELVQRHLNLVYSVAVRQVNGDAHLAQDITQLVFTDLARKAHLLANHPVLAGWLFTSTRYAAGKAVRRERRRALRERAAHLMQETLHFDSDAQLAWDRVRPVLDEALGELAERDRLAILLRFFEGCDYAGIGAQLALSENAARMRVDRAVDKLRGLLQRRGIASTSAAVATVLAAQSVVAAPAGLAASVAIAAVAAPASLATTALTLMSTAKLQGSVAGLVLAVGSALFIAQHRESAALHAQLAAMPQVADDLPQLRQANEDMAREAHQARAARVSDEELSRLSNQAAVHTRKFQNPAQPASLRPDKIGGLDTYSMEQLDRKPKPVQTPIPVYPPEMSAAGVAGEVAVEFVINSAGQVSAARVLRSSNPAFEKPALAAIGKWKFNPGMIGEQMVNVRVIQRINFNLQSDASPASENWF